jgi:phytase-like protein
LRRGLTRGRLLAAGFFALCVTDAAAPAPTAAPAAAAALPAVRLVPVGRYDFEAPAFPERDLRPEGLSGIAYLGDDQFLAVGDEHATIHRLTIDADSVSGKIRAVRFGAPIRLLDSLGAHVPDSVMGKDREGIALDVSRRSVWIANERTGADLHRPSLERYSVETGRMAELVRVDSHPMLRVFEKIRVNLGFESLTRRPGAPEFWTGNEGPLTVDGVPANDTAGAVVRLQKLDDSMRPIAQYAYEVDRYPARITSPFFLMRADVSGLSDLLALDDGRLLALERSFAGDSSGYANLRNRIYLVDVSEATDVSKGETAAGLRGRAYTPARKTLLWELNSGFTNSNFEGMALGRRLKNGDRLLVLIADNDTGRNEALYALRLTGL